MGGDLGLEAVLLPCEAEELVLVGTTMALLILPKVALFLEEDMKKYKSKADFDGIDPKLCKLA